MGANEITGQVFADLARAAKAYGKAHGVYGKAGGWLYKDGILLRIQGWQNYGIYLVRKGLLDPQDENGVSVYRFPGEGTGLFGRGTVTYAAEREWRSDARQYAITEGEK